MIKRFLFYLTHLLLGLRRENWRTFLNVNQINTIAHTELSKIYQNMPNLDALRKRLMRLRKDRKYHKELFGLGFESSLVVADV